MQRCLERHVVNRPLGVEYSGHAESIGVCRQRDCHNYVQMILIWKCFMTVVIFVHVQWRTRECLNTVTTFGLFSSAS